MNDVMPLQFSYATLFDPAVARAAIERAALWALPRRVCHPLEQCARGRISADLAAFDAEVEMASVPEEELLEASPSSDDTKAAALEQDSQFEDADDL